MRMEINVTLECDLACRYCNRMLDTHPVSDSQVTHEQMQWFVCELRRAGVRLRRLKVSGGEPTTHPELASILQLLIASRDVIDKVVLQTNKKNPEVEDLPRGLRTKISPPRSKDHVPFLISPYDLGATGHYGVSESCVVQRRCGRSFEKWGFTACPVAGTLGRLLDVNPYFTSFRTRGQLDICRHCPYSVRPELQSAMRLAARNGEIQYPTSTFVDALKKRDPSRISLEPWTPNAV